MYEFSKSAGGDNKGINSISWKYNIVTLDHR